MAVYGTPITVTYVAWDTANNAGRTGDAANHTLRWVRDGVSVAPTNSPAEVDAVSAPGVYRLSLTAAETQAATGTLAGVSATAGVVILPVQLSFHRLPDADPGTDGGLPTVDANNHVAGVQGTPAVNVTQISGDPAAADNLEAILDGTGGQATFVSAAATPGIEISTAVAGEPALLIEDRVVGGGNTAAVVQSLFAGTPIMLGTTDLVAKLDAIETDTGTDLPGLINGLNDLSSADIDARLAAYDAPTKAEMDSALAEIKGATFDPLTDSLEAIRDRGDAAWVTGSGADPAAIRAEIDANSTQLAAIRAKTDQIQGAGDGDTPVNHDTGGTDQLRATDAAGAGLDNVTIRAYLKAEFDADATAAPLRGRTVTGADGRWIAPLMLNSGLTYTLIYSRADLNTTTLEVTVP